jgi:hypothetical protein
MLLVAPGLAPEQVDGRRLIDVAPTLAAWLGLSMPDVAGVARWP